MIPVDRRLALMCDKQGLHYSRFVDDITISGRYPIMSGSYPKVMVEVLTAYGFKVNQRKHAEALEREGRFAEGKCITKLEIRRGQIRVGKAFIEQVQDQLSDAARLAAGKPLLGLYYTDNQIHGRIHYVRWINTRQAIPLLHQYQTVNWPRAEAEARERGLIKTTKHTQKKAVSVGGSDS